MPYFVTHEVDAENGRPFMPFENLLAARKYAQERATESGTNIGIHQIEAESGDAAIAGIKIEEGEQIDLISPKRTDAQIEADRRKEARRQLNEL